MRLRNYTRLLTEAVCPLELSNVAQRESDNLAKRSFVFGDAYSSGVAFNNDKRGTFFGLSPVWYLCDRRPSRPLCSFVFFSGSATSRPGASR